MRERDRENYWRLPTGRMRIDNDKMDEYSVDSSEEGTRSELICAKPLMPGS